MPTAATTRATAVAPGCGCASSRQDTPTPQRAVPKGAARFGSGNRRVETANICSWISSHPDALSLIKCRMQLVAGGVADGDERRPSDHARPSSLDPEDAEARCRRHGGRIRSEADRRVADRQAADRLAAEVDALAFATKCAQRDEHNSERLLKGVTDARLPTRWTAPCNTPVHPVGNNQGAVGSHDGLRRGRGS